MSSDHDNTHDELELVLVVAAKQIYKGIEAAKFLSWFRESMPSLAPVFAGSIAQADEGRDELMYWLGRSLWNAFPQPSNRLRPKPLPKPAANGRCPCGSGAKHKQCCARLPIEPGIFESINLLYYVLDEFSQARLKQIDARYIDPYALADVADRWALEGKHMRTISMLEPVFAEGKKLPKHPGLLLNALFDSWPSNHKTKSRQKICERLEKHNHPEVACAALQTGIAMQINVGELDAASQRIISGMRQYPNDVNFAPLELLVLLGKGQADEAQRRAEFWVYKLNQLGDQYDDFAQSLIAMVDPKENASQLQNNQVSLPELEPIISLLKSEPIVFDSYDSPDNTEYYVLTPSTELARLERSWMDKVSANKPLLTDIGVDEDPIPPWEMLDRVVEKPAYLNSIDILDDITQSLDAYADEIPGFAIVLVLLLQRAETMLFGVLTKSKPKTLVSVEDWSGLVTSLGFEVPWGFLNNRPILRMMAMHVYHYRRRQINSSAIWLPRAQNLLVLNPDDNHGFRSLVSTELIKQRQYSACLELLDRYPDDGMLDVTMNRVLALYNLKREAEAATVLKSAGVGLREIRKAIKSKNYPKPRDFDSSPLYVGGRSEAWLYRDEMLTSWQHSQAIQWLKKQPNPRTPKQQKREVSEPIESIDFKDVKSPSENNFMDVTPGASPELLQPLSTDEMKNQLVELGEHGPWLLGVTLAAALTPSPNFAVQRLLSPVFERLMSDDTSSGIVDESSEDVFGNQLATKSLELFMAWYNHFISRIIETESEQVLDEFSCSWLIDDLSIAKLNDKAVRDELVAGIVAAIEANPRGWNPIPTDARNRVLGPFQLLVASKQNDRELEESSTRNIVFLDSADGVYEMDEHTCLRNIQELVSIAILTRIVN